MKLLLTAAVLAAPLASGGVRFEENRGQAPGEVRFVARHPAGRYLLLADGFAAESPGSRVDVRFHGAEPGARVEGEGLLAARSHYFTSGASRTHIPNYARVRYDGLYPGAAAVFYGNAEGSLEFDVHLDAHAAADRVTLSFTQPVSIGADGALRAGPLRLRPPLAWQTDGARRLPVSCRYAVRGGGRVGFALGHYDRSLPLTIDPVLDYASYLGGTGGSTGESVAVDRDGNIYVTGTTTSGSFPLQNPMQPWFNGSNEIFVSKFDRTGRTLLYSTYIGSWGDDRALDLAVDAAGAVCVTGYSTSPDFPLVKPLQPQLAGGSQANGGDAILFKLSPDGAALEFSTFLGGSGDEFARSLAIDAEGNVWIAGATTSMDMPVVKALQAEFAGGTRDVFLWKVSAGGDALLFSTYIGGPGTDEGFGVAADTAGAAYVVGTTTSDFPRVNPIQATYQGGTRDAFFLKVAADGSELLYSTTLGGTADDFARSVVVDEDGHAYVAGYTTSSGFPTRNPIQRSYGTNRDAFIAKLAQDGGSLVYSTFLGGRSLDDAYGIAIDAARRVSVVGITQSPNFPVVEPVQAAIGSPCSAIPCTADLFVASVSAEGTALLYSTYLGGLAAEAPRAIALDAEGRAWVTGNSSSANFPTRSAFQSRNTGGGAAVAIVASIRGE